MTYLTIFKLSMMFKLDTGKSPMSSYVIWQNKDISIKDYLEGKPLACKHWSNWVFSKRSIIGHALLMAEEAK